MKTTLLATCVATAVLAAGLAHAQPGQPLPAKARAAAIEAGALEAPDAFSVYIVRLSDMPAARYRGGIEGLAPTSPVALGTSKYDASSAASQAYVNYLRGKQADFISAASDALGRSVDVMGKFYYATNGVALWIRNDEAAALANLAGVDAVEKEKLRRIDTDAGPEWIGAPEIWNGNATTDALGTKGEGVVVGIIDTGVNTDHPSFADPGPVDNYDHSNPLSEYKGQCDPILGTPFCNDKLVGVYDCNVGGPQAAGAGGGNSPPKGPHVSLLNGGAWTGATCATIDGPHEFNDLVTGDPLENGTSIEFTVNTANPADDITMTLLYRATATDPWTEVAYYDFLFGLETSTYQPNGGVPVGQWGLEVCAYAGQDPIGPATYTGSLTWNDANIGLGDFCYGGVIEDANQHGSHTASTAAGNHVDASIVAPTITIEKTLSGVAPHASLITYAGCLPEGGCLGLSLTNAIEQIVVDGVDVANYSIGGNASNAWSDSDSLGFLSAREAGIWVATSASNDGPGAGSIGSPADAPWITTVGASTHNRVINNTLENMTGGDTAAPADIVGKGLTSDYPTTGTAPIVYAGDYLATGDPTADPALCAGGDANASTSPFAPGTFAGEIVVCDRGTYARVDKCRHVCEAGAGGCILANNLASGDSLVADGHSCPAVHITYDDGVVLKNWLAGGTGHEGRITGSVFDLSPVNGDVEAGFSSRGPNFFAPNNLKPDVTNPGVDILAAINTAGNSNPDPLNGEFGSLSGTSMSSPHTAGSYALLKAKRPEFTPHEAQSALMMTSTREFTRDSNGSDAGDPFDRGAGRVDLTRAAKAGLVMEAKDMDNPTGPEYGASSADAKSINLPSFSDANCGSICSWTREVKSAASVPVTWSAGFQSEDGVTVEVTPSEFTLAPGAKIVLTVTANIATAQPATPQGPPSGPTDVNESQHYIPPGTTSAAITRPACFASFNGRDHDCWVFADVALFSSDNSVPDVSMPLAARSTGDIDGDGLKDLVDTDSDNDTVDNSADNCPLTFNPGQSDSDTDGVGDACDNCTLVSNASQCDTNGDGYGNHCDADLNNDNIVNSFDLSIMRQNFGSTTFGDSDLNCDGITNSFDLSIMRQNFGGNPGPSAFNP